MRKQIALSLFYGCLWGCLAAQDPKGINPVIPAATPDAGQTYAVVVGISDYWDPAIPDLRFADRDAEAFANFLRSPAGGSLDGDHLRLLVNAQATGAQIVNALDWLLEVAQANNEVVIYFSGHGDVEGRRISNPGYLLGWDAPSRAYAAGGTINVRDFQDYVTTLSAQNNARVVVITDACHAGKLSGSDINGVQLTGQSLAKQLANEVKILSCQANEYSIEGEQWGGGRGAFSYNLVDALYGLADQNNDLYVTLQEVGRYLEDHVTAEVAPLSQVPVVVGNRTERLAAVDARLLVDLRAGRTSQMQMLSPIEVRGMEEEVLAGVDTTVRALYRLFKQALKDKVFLAPAGACADAYYEKLIAEPKLARLHSTLRRNYAAALQDDAQQVLNTILKTGLTEDILSSTKTGVLYSQYPRYLQRAAELLGEGHYMYAVLQARKCYFEGEIATTYSEKRRAYRAALQWQPDMPHALVGMMYTFGAAQADSAYLYFSKATAQAPAWIVPYLALYGYYHWRTKQDDKAEEMLNRAGQIDSTSVLVFYEKARFYTVLKKYEAAEYWYLKTISGASTDICFPCAYNSLGIFYCDYVRRYVEAEAAFKKAIQLDSTNASYYYNLSNVYRNTGRYTEVEIACKKAIALDSTMLEAYNNLGFVYGATRRYEEAEATYKKAIQIDSTSYDAYNGLGVLYCDKLQRYAEAEAAFKKAIQIDSTAANAYGSLGNTYRNEGRITEAEQVTKKSIELDPNDANKYSILGSIYHDTKRYEESEAAYKKAIQVDSNFFRAYTNIGNLYLETGRYEEAEASLKSLILLDPNHISANRLLASVYMHTNRYAEAEQVFNKVLLLLPGDRSACYDLACVYSLQNKTDQAFEKLEAAIQAGYDNYRWMQEDTDLAHLREQAARWKALMKKHFPEQVKD